uniref:BZIP domain-containing protein n=1 Tax=Leptocylindrus danicus TaxID=163516 RepID=A0A7S2KJT3_9STRA|mmetsp:Transcript_22855/g.34302  ORF Transcript_22855/g.34302 Transcript_22855/m.34302 type:complete len:243 (+) Transcript_22855:60-788(+)|eukprot:CAMPEP_0116033356 /NCGR_PEP_ID=MMETSP0321-20121206/18918_1 /TAXON_ID=163516 /ORGANISM="Leptocylindrus danicus var. danicus, Strain B650" /LENGTH=242 /DNA_ID=CAMNT_0003509371 /DNA_START=55 /DNA_END=783 /DNA_ORIENTATION=+
MMSAVVAPVAVPIVDAQSAAMARKRRVELRKISRASVSSSSSGSESEDAPPPVSTNLVSPVLSAATSMPIATKKRKSTTTGAMKQPSKKRPTQMRYDPEVPMTKEEAAAWRREARRVRNRQSAAASRQKTRDRIDELEAEVQGWQKKMAALQAKVRAYEQEHSVQVVSAEMLDATTTMNTTQDDVQVRAKEEAILSSTTTPSAVTAAALVDLSPVLSAVDKVIGEGGLSMEQHLNMISRPAV